MSYPIPRIVYNPGSGNVTLNFTYPPIQKAMLDDKEAVRHDSMSSSGLRQVAVERVDTIKPLQFENVPWADLPACGAFIDYALLGGEFSYFPDATLTAFQTYELLDTNFSPKFNARGLSKFSLKLRLVPGGDSAP
jgi:hypothetical protein